ncbi:MAG: hypothetical protein RI928_1585 [Pseudomonadota bacterium]
MSVLVKVLLIFGGIEFIIRMSVRFCTAKEIDRYQKNEKKTHHVCHGPKSENMKNCTRVSRLLPAVLLSIANMVSAAAPVIILDPGHDPLYPGALGSCGELEFTYNDRIVAAYLKTTSARVITTRDAGQPPGTLKLKTGIDGVRQSRYTLRTSLQARTILASSSKASLFISIHHDSTASRFITPDKSICQGRGGHTLLPEFKARNDIGFNVFIDQDPKNPQYQQSLRFASLLGQELIGIGRKPSNYHYFPEDDCRSCRPVIRELGVWHQQLYVLRHVRMPAVLVEVGNIADAEDEALVNSEQFREQFAQALKRAVDRYFSEAKSD